MDQIQRPGVVDAAAVERHKDGRRQERGGLCPVAGHRDVIQRQRALVVDPAAGPGEVLQTAAQGQVLQDHGRAGIDQQHAAMRALAVDGRPDRAEGRALDHDRPGSPGSDLKVRPGGICRRDGVGALGQADHRRPGRGRAAVSIAAVQPLRVRKGLCQPAGAVAGRGLRTGGGDRDQRAGQRRRGRSTPPAPPTAPVSTTSASQPAAPRPPHLR